MVVGGAQGCDGMEAEGGRSARAGFQLHLTKAVDAQELYQAVEEVRSN